MIRATLIEEPPYFCRDSTRWTFLVTAPRPADPADVKFGAEVASVLARALNRWRLTHMIDYGTVWDLHYDSKAGDWYDWQVTRRGVWGPERSGGRVAVQLVLTA